MLPVFCLPGMVFSRPINISCLPKINLPSAQKQYLSAENSPWYIVVCQVIAPASQRRREDAKTTIREASGETKRKRGVRRITGRQKREGENEVIRESVFLRSLAHILRA